MKKEKIEAVIEVNGRQYGKKQLIELLVAYGKLSDYDAEKNREIASLKSVIGGYKTSNMQYRQRIGTLTQTEKDLRSQMANLAEKLDKAEAYGKEADEIIENKSDKICELNNTINSLEASLGEEKCRYKEIEQLNINARKRVSELETELEFAKVPWWKKLF